MQVKYIIILSLRKYKECQHVYVFFAAAKSLQSCPTLCDPINGSPPGSPIPGILHTRTLEWVAISFSKNEVAQSCPTVSDPMDCSPPGSSVHGIFQAGVLPFPSPEDLPDPGIEPRSPAL